MANFIALFIGEIEIRSKAIADLWSLLRTKDSQFLQRSSSKWLKEDGTNSVYFHASIKSMSIRNTILALKVGEAWIEGVSNIRCEVVNHFTESFKEPNVDWPRLDDVVFRSLWDEDNLFIIGPL